jgi:hypothetical protein
VEVQAHNVVLLFQQLEQEMILQLHPLKEIQVFQAQVVMAVAVVELVLSEVIMQEVLVLQVK